MTAPHELTASEATAAMREGRLTSVGLVRACLDRIAAREPEIQAWTALDPEGALAEARAADKVPSLASPRCSSRDQRRDRDR